MRTKQMCSIGLVIALIAATTSGCKRDAAPSAEAKPLATADTAKAAAKPASTVVPGSHEDWCDEHHVPESQCTKCNPDLVPAFKASGDWCKEHDVPESQCTKCDPKRKAVRPPKKS